MRTTKDFDLGLSDNRAEPIRRLSELLQLSFDEFTFRLGANLSCAGVEGRPPRVLSMKIAFSVSRTNETDIVWRCFQRQKEFPVQDENAHKGPVCPYPLVVLGGSQRSPDTGPTGKAAHHECASFNHGPGARKALHWIHRCRERRNHHRDRHWLAALRLARPDPVTGSRKVDYSGLDCRP